MQNRYVKIAFDRISDDALITLGQTVVTAMTDNPNFETPTPTLVSIQELMEDFQQKLSLTRKGSPLNTSEKNLSRQFLESELKKLAMYVNMVSDGALHIVLSSGFPIRQQRSSMGIPAIPERIRLSDTGQSGQLRMAFIAVKNAWEYEYCCATELDESGSPMWGEIHSTTNSRFTVLTALQPGSTCHVKIRSRNGKGVSDWSEIVRLIVR